MAGLFARPQRRAERGIHVQSVPYKGWNVGKSGSNYFGVPPGENRPAFANERSLDAARSRIDRQPPPTQLENIPPPMPGMGMPPGWENRPAPVDTGLTTGPPPTDGQGGTLIDGGPRAIPIPISTQPVGSFKPVQLA